MNKKRKAFLTVLLLSIFFGNLGIHRFYTKKVVTGVLMLITLGGCGIWYIVDLIVILTGNFKDENGKDLSFSPNKKAAV